MFFLGLTGSPGAGKSEVLKWLRSKGAATLSADLLGHHLLRRAPLKARLVRRFGKTILGPDGKILRHRLAKAAFRTPADADFLNRVLHPAIRREVKAWKRKMLRRRPHVGLGVVEAALLHEGGWTSLFDGILCVSAPERVRRARLKKRGWDLGGIRHRERLQWTDRRKVRHSDWILTNSGTKRELRSRVEKWRNHRGFGGTD